jgi:serine/threonine-protein kinase HipA
MTRAWHGAIRFAAHEGGPFLRQDGAKRIPPVIELPRLLSAAEYVVKEKDTDEDLRLLFAPGSSLGGARPKASVRDEDGHLAIAKFPRRDDEYNTVVWEAVAFTVAHKAGITVQCALKRSGNNWCFFCGASTVRAQTAFRSFRP